MDAVGGVNGDGKRPRDGDDGVFLGQHLVHRREDDVPRLDLNLGFRQDLSDRKAFGEDLQLPAPVLDHDRIGFGGGLHRKRRQPRHGQDQNARRRGQASCTPLAQFFLRNS